MYVFASKRASLPGMNPVWVEGVLQIEMGDNVYGQAAYRLDGGLPTVCLSDELYPVLLLQPGSQPFARQRLVVDDQRSDHDAR